MDNLDAFIEDIKRVSAYGNVTVTSDKATADILNSVVNSLDLIAKYWPWDWLLEPVSITLLPGVSVYTLPLNIESLVGIAPAVGRPLRRVTYKQYLTWHKDDDAPEGLPEFYVPYGRAATGARKVIVGNIPSANTVLTGLGKLKLTRFVAADLGTAKSFLPFPEDNMYLLRAFVMADVKEYQQKAPEGEIIRRRALETLKSMAGQETTDPAAEVSASVPAYYRDKQRARRGGRVV